MSQCERDRFLEMLNEVENYRRKIPVPRRLLRLLCGTTRPVLVATVLGHLVRCQYYRKGLCCPDGRCKASWIATVFEVDARNVKAARRELVSEGILIMDPTDQRSMNRWGPRVRLNLGWRDRAFWGDSSPPPAHELQPRSPPPNNNWELATRMKDDKPAARGPVGALAQSPEPSPTLRSVTLDDLQQPERTALLFEEAVQRGYARAALSEKLNVFAAAEHAKACGRRNPCGLFVWLLKRRGWKHLTLRDEDRARHALQQLNASVSGGSGRAKACRTESGSASGTAHSTAPETARQILAGTGNQAYPILARLSLVTGTNEVNRRGEFHNLRIPVASASSTVSK